MSTSPKANPYQCPVCLEYVEAMSTDREVFCVRCEKLYILEKKDD